MKRTAVAAVLCLLGAPPARAEEGLWTLQQFPRAEVQARHGFAPDEAFVDRVRRSMVIMGACSGTFVSPEGLVLLHRDCATSCLGMRAAVERSQALFGEACRDKRLRRALPLFDRLYCAPLDRREQQLSERMAFVANRRSDEVVCTNRALRVLESVRDITDRMKQAFERGSGASVFEAVRAESRKIRQECGAGEAVACDIRDMYDGARWELHRYRYYRDVRLVFSPEAAVAEFGVEGSSFTFPQQRFPATLVRVYENGRPAKTPYLPLAHNGPREGQLVFVSGYPPSTARRASVASLVVSRERNVWGLPISTEVRGLIHQYGKHKLDPVRARVEDAGAERPVLAIRAQLEALSPELIARVQEREKALRARVDADPVLRGRYAQAWPVQERALREYETGHRNQLLVQTAGCGTLNAVARGLVHAAAERAKPAAEREESYSEGLAQTERGMLRPFSVDEGLETEYLSYCFRLFQEELGRASPLLKEILQGRSPDEVARDLIHNSRLGETRVRRALWDGGQAAVAASSEPLIALWRRIHDDVNAARRRYEEQVGGPLARSSVQIGQARFEVFGTSEYPDANGTLRLRVGTVSGSNTNGSTVAPFVPVSAMFGLATGRAPFDLPGRWIAAKPSLDLGLPLAFTADADVVLSASGTDDKGAAVLDRNRQVVGMVFGGNEAAAGSLYAFQPQVRAVALTSAALLHVLEQVYGAGTLVQELRAAR